MLNRRGFLGALATALAGATLDPEKLLWEPGKRMISIPAPVVRAGLPPYSWITAEILQVLKNKLVLNMGIYDTTWNFSHRHQKGLILSLTPEHN